MDKLSGEPLFFAAADRKSLVLSDAGHVVSQPRHDFVLRVEKRQPREELGDNQQVLPGLGIGGGGPYLYPLRAFWPHRVTFQTVFWPFGDATPKRAPPTA